MSVSGLGGFGDRLWLAVKPYRIDIEETRFFLAELSIPSLQMSKWYLPELPESVDTGREGVSIVADADSVYVGRSHATFSIGHRASRQWDVRTDVSPSTPLVDLGDAVYFGVEANGATGLVRYLKQSRQFEQLVSNRRVPAQSPLDQPSLRILDVRSFGEDGLEVEAILERSSFGRKGIEGATFLYWPKSGKWREADTQFYVARTRAIPHPISRPGNAAISYAKAPGESLMLQLPDPARPSAIIPLKFRFQERGQTKDLPSVSTTPITWYWLPGGYVARDEYGSRFWFVPAEKLKGYLDSHPAQPTALAPLAKDFQTFKMQFQ